MSSLFSETAEHTVIHKLLLEEMLQHHAKFMDLCTNRPFLLETLRGRIDLEVNNEHQLWMNNIFWIETPPKVIVYITNLTLPD